MFDIFKAISATSGPSRNRNTFSGSMGAGMINLRSNVIRPGGTSLGASGSSGLISIPDRSLGSWLKVSNEIRFYEMFDFTQNVIRLFTDYIDSQIDNKPATSIEITGDAKLSEKVNTVIKDTGFNNIFLESIEELIYYGSKGFRITNNSAISTKKKLGLLELKDPYRVFQFATTITNKNRNRIIPEVAKNYLKSDELIKSYKVLDGNTLKDVDYDDLLVLGELDFKLDYEDGGETTLNSLLSSDKSKVTLNSEKANLDSITNMSKLTAAKPIFYSLTSKLKEYIVKEVLISVLGIRELLMPTFMKLGVDLTKATDTNAITSTVNELESRINESIDASMLMGDNLDLNQLITAMFSTVRVLPDPGNLISSMDELNMEPIKDKLNSIVGEREQLRNTILESIGIPPDLFEGGSNQYEVLTRSQRYESAVASLVKMLKNSYVNGVIKLYLISTGDKLTDELYSQLVSMKVNLFRVSSIELNKIKTIVEQNQEVLDSIERMVSTANGLIENSPLIVKDKALEILRSTMSSLGSSYQDLIVDKIPENTEEESGGFGGGFGGSKFGSFSTLNRIKNEDRDNIKEIVLKYKED